MENEFLRDMEEERSEFSIWGMDWVWWDIERSHEQENESDGREV